MFKKINLILIAQAVIVALFVSGLTLYVSADWTQPVSSAPTCPVSEPGCNVPLNVGAQGQIKRGGLAIATDPVAVGLTVLNGRVGIGTIDPQQRLDVAGYVKGTGFCLSDGCKTQWGSASGSIGLTDCKWTPVSHYGSDQASTCNAVFGDGYVMVGQDHRKDNGYIRYSSNYCCKLVIN